MKRLFVLILLSALPLIAARTGGIQGRVTAADTGKPLGGVKLVVARTGISTKTDAKGVYHLTRIPVGIYTLQVSYPHYATRTLTKVKVKKGRVTTRNIKLKHLKTKKTTPEISKIYKDQPAKTGNSVDRTTPESLKNSLRKPSGPALQPASGGKTSTLPGSKPKVENRDKPGSVPTPPSPKEPVDRPPATAPMKDSVKPSSGWRLFNKVESDAGLGSEQPTPGLIDEAAKYRPRKPISGGLKASYADDNQQFNYFLGFLNKFDLRNLVIPYDISERIQIQIQDARGKQIPDLPVKVYNPDLSKVLTAGRTYSDGSFFIFPAEFAGQDQTYKLAFTDTGEQEIIDIYRNGPRKILVQTTRSHTLPKRSSVDIVFILDTTGSMGEEIQRLLETIDVIHMNLTSLASKPLLRFGMVLYRDKADSYRTRVIPFTTDISEFRRALIKVQAAGGGDTPEDLQAALASGLHVLQWSERGLRLGFVITDAPPHLDYGQDFTYIDAALEAKQQGIKLFTVGTGGLDIQGEYILRQIAQLTYAKYLFLTYGQETGENAGGRPGSVSHHTGSNYQTDKLEAIIIRIAKEEIFNFADIPLEQGEDYFEAAKVDDESREETLALLFRDAIIRLIDYSTLELDDTLKLGVLPIHTQLVAAKLNAEYFSEQLQFSITQAHHFTLVARKDLQQVLNEQKLQLSGLLSEDQTTRIGELMGAELLLSGELYVQDNGFEIFLKLLRVQTGEVLAVTKLLLDQQLGL